MERESSGNIRKIITQSGTTYTISFDVCLIDKNNEDNVGVTDICIINTDLDTDDKNVSVSECFIGKHN